MKVVVAILKALLIGMAAGAVVMIAMQLDLPSHLLRRARLLVYGLLFSMPMLQARFSRAFFGPTTLSARLSLAGTGAVGCYLGALAALGPSDLVQGDLWIWSLVWVIAALASEMLLYLWQELA